MKFIALFFIQATRLLAHPISEMKQKLIDSEALSGSVLRNIRDSQIVRCLGFMLITFLVNLTNIPAYDNAPFISINGLPKVYIPVETSVLWKIVWILLVTGINFVIGVLISISVFRITRIQSIIYSSYSSGIFNLFAPVTFLVGSVVGYFNLWLAIFVISLPSFIFWVYSLLFLISLFAYSNFSFLRLFLAIVLNVAAAAMADVFQIDEYQFQRQSPDAPFIRPY